MAGIMKCIANVETYRYVFFEQLGMVNTLAMNIKASLENKAPLS